MFSMRVDLFSACFKRAEKQVHHWLYLFQMQIAGNYF